MTRVGLDSNILAYLAGVSRSAEDDDKIAHVRDLIARLSTSASLVAPAQALGELFVVLRRSGASATDARAILIEFAEAFGTSSSETRTALSAADLVVDHKLQFWDALIVTAAADAGCVLLLSEDMQNGFVARGLTIINPLASDVHPKLAALDRLQIS
jgi:predicted nucleic acid-binding protein